MTTTKPAARKRTPASRTTTHPGKAAARRPRRRVGQEAVAPSQDLADLRRQQILDAAEACFRRHGFHSASMAEIAKSFGMSAGHIYNYFDSKEAIIAGIVERDVDDALRRAVELQAATDMQSALLERVDRSVTDTLNRSKAARQFEVLAEAGRNAEVLALVRNADAKVRAVLRDIFRRTQADGHSGHDLDGKVAVLMALFDGLMVRGLRQPDVPRAQVTRVVRGLLREMMR